MWVMGETWLCTACPEDADGFDLFSSRGLIPIFVLLLIVSYNVSQWTGTWLSDQEHGPASEILIVSGTDVAPKLH